VGIGNGKQTKRISYLPKKHHPPTNVKLKNMKNIISLLLDHKYLNNFILLLFFSGISLNCNNKNKDYYVNDNKIAASIDVYQLNDQDRAILYLKNLSKETKSIILLGKVKDSISALNCDIYFEVIQNSCHTFSHLIKFENHVVSEMYPTKYKLGNNTPVAISLSYIGNFRSDFNLNKSSFKIRAIVIPSRINIELYTMQNDNAYITENMITDTIKTQFLTIKQL
jgi:hypothetical protein